MTGDRTRARGRPCEHGPEKILDAAMLLFAQRGFEGTNTRQIAKRVGCNSALISYHFRDKGGLFDFGCFALSHRPMHQALVREMLSGGKTMVRVLSRSDAGMTRLLRRRLEKPRWAHELKTGFDLQLAAVSLIGPIIYSVTLAPILKEAYGTSEVDEAYMASLCTYLAKTFFGAWGTNAS